MKPAAPGSSVVTGFDVQPPHVYYASFMLRNAQYDFADRAKSLVDTLDGYEHAVGCGTGPEAFAKAYAEVAVLFLGVWDRATEGVGGAAVGLTVTANNYAEAEHATNILTPAVVKKSPPAVLKKAGAGGPVADLAWGNAPAEDGWGNAIIDEVAGALSWVGDHVLRPVLKHALQHGKVADITPGGDDVSLPKIAQAWRQAATDAKKSAGTFDDAIGYITNPAPGNDEWQSAMKQFCSAIWGTTSYGKETHGYKWSHSDGQQPALDVLQDTARGVATACDGVSSEVTKIRSTIVDVYKDAAAKTFAVKGIMDALEKLSELPELAAEFISNIDTGRLNHAVDSYNNEINTLAHDLDKLKPALTEAELSVPRYAAEEARAENFGARSLNDFKQSYKWTDPQDTQQGKYKIDLASSEGFVDDRGRASHIIDKHVGKTDAQLIQRFRDDLKQDGTPFPGSSSTFKTLDTGQRFTQQAIDANNARIKDWLRTQPDPNPNNRAIGLPVYDANEVTGRSVTKRDYLNFGEYAPVNEVGGVKVVLKYDQSLDPPFFVYTAYPAAL
ncbi:RNase A-like domain-containing protein [Streptomyces galilaeus]